MRSKWFVLVAAVSVVFGAVGVAGAAPLNWEGTVTVDLGDAPPFPMVGGGVATVNASAGVIPAHLNTLRLKGSRGQVGGTGSLIVTDPGSLNNGIARVIVEAQLGTGTFAPISGGAATTAVLTRSILPVGGVLKLCLLTTACTDFIPLLLTEPTTVNGTPGTGLVGVGIGGLITAGNTTVQVSLQAQPWTIKTASAIDEITTPGGNKTLVTVTAQGFAHGPASGTSSTAEPSGVVQLVTPAQLNTNLTNGSDSKISTLVTLTVHFIPEPGWLLLLGSGVVGLACLGRARRLRKR